YNSHSFDNAFQISQTLPFPSLIGAKKKLFDAQSKGMEWQKELSVNELKSQVRSYYYQLEYLQHNADKLLYLDSLFIDFIRIASLRYTTGDTRKTDISTAETKQGEINLLYRQNEVLRQNAYNSLKTLMQTEEDFQIRTGNEYRPLLLSRVLDSNSIASHP